MISIELTPRQREILRIVKEQGPITGEKIAELLGLTRATLRPDLAILTMAGYLEARPRVGYFYAGRGENRIFLEHIRSFKVKDFHAPPVVIFESESVYEAIVRLFLEDVGTLYILDKDRLLAGVVSRKDLLRAALGNKDLTKIPVGVIMTRMPHIYTTTPEESVYDAAKKLIVQEVDSLPVVVPRSGWVGGWEVVGRFTKTTVTRAFLALAEEDEDITPPGGRATADARERGQAMDRERGEERLPR